MSETTIAIGIWDGVEELDFVGPYEVLTAWSGYANGDGIRVLTVAERAGEIRCAHGLRVVPDATWDDVGDVDVVLLPGGNTRGLVGDERVLDHVREQAKRGALMTSVCTGLARSCDTIASSSFLNAVAVSASRRARCVRTTSARRARDSATANGNAMARKAPR